MLAHNAVVLVADGGKAILFRNHGKGGEVSLREERKLSPHTMVNDGPSGSRPPEQSISQTSEATFVKHLADALLAMYEAGDFKELVLIADPRSLGELREAMAKPVASSIVDTMSKDLTNHKIADIEAALRK